MSREDGTLGEQGMDRRGWQLSCYRGYYRERRKLCNSVEVWGWARDWVQTSGVNFMKEDFSPT